MALIKCLECGKEMSNSAKNCPHCGAKPPYKPSLAFILITGLLVVFAIKGIFGGENSTPPPAKTAAAIAAEEAQERRFLVTVITAKKLKNSLREPDSVDWIDILVDEKAETVCLKYRARNGFGGMSIETMAVTSQEAGSDADTWNRHCAGVELYNMSYAKTAL